MGSTRTAGLTLRARANFTMLSRLTFLSPRTRQLLIYPLVGFLPTILVAHVALLSPLGSFANSQKEPASSATPGTTCRSTLAPSLVADINLQSQEIVFTTSDDGKKETFPVLVSNLSRAGMKSILVTNAGIYGTDN